MNFFSGERGAELREIFFESAQELLQSLNDEALKLEREPGDAEVVRSMRRIVHTLKGDAAACGFRELSESAHHLEDALAAEALSPEASLAELAFTAADTFGAMLASYQQNVKPPSAEPLRKMVDSLLASRQNPQKLVPGPQPDLGFVPSEAERSAAHAATARGRNVYHIVTQIDSLCAMPIAARQLILNALSGAGEVLGTRPEASSVSPANHVQLLFASARAAEAIASMCRIPTVVADVQVTPAENAILKNVTPARLEPAGDRPANQASDSVSRSVAQESAPTPGQTAAAAVENILRVDAERIDNVLNLVGELIIGKSMMQQIFNELARKYPKEGLRGRFSDTMAFQSRVLQDLQRSVMKIRMVPVEQLFRRFPRLVRDVARQCGRQVELKVHGQDTDLDKSLLDAIAEPLTHLVRNAISHGIETAEERVVRGKPAAGTIRLDAYHQGNQVIVEIRDDGAGIDLPKIRAKAIQKGLLSEEEAGRLNESGTLDLIFRPGFSTADQITEVAGRGVGLDVVQSVVHRLKGSLSMETQPGEGTTFKIKLPLTLAIITALLFRVEQRLYAVPLNSVAEITRARESDLHRVDRFEVLQLRDKALSMVRLGRPPEDAEQSASKKLFVLVMSVGDRKLGLIVDSLEGEEELVIKALDDQTVATDLVSGASILGDGRVVLILNLAAIVERTGQKPEGENGISFGLLLTQADRARMALQTAGGRS